VTLQNRVTPLGELIADPARGLVYGNRGCLHDDHGRIRRSHQVKRWIACRLEFRGRRRGPLMQPGRFTELFFLDEATALAAGHRPCALCRRGDYDFLVEVWASLHEDQRGADAIDSQLHRERIAPGSGKRSLHTASFDELPDGTFVLESGEPWLVVGDERRKATARPCGDRDTRMRGSSRHDRSSHCCATTVNRSSHCCIRPRRVIA
jgi:hypothetical protein